MDFFSDDRCPNSSYAYRALETCYSFIQEKVTSAIAVAKSEQEYGSYLLQIETDEEFWFLHQLLWTEPGKMKKKWYEHGKICTNKARKKNVLVLVIRRVDFDANKKNVGRKIKMTLRKRQSPVFSLPVNHQHPRSSAFRVADMNVWDLSLFFCVHFSLPFRHDTHIKTGLIWISSFKTC